VARILAKILHGLSLIPSDKVVEKAGNDLTAGYVGQTSEKVQQILKEADGGLLFIDEAYSLGNGPFGKEALDTLVQAMTSPEYSGVVIILAGYSKDLEDMMNVNPGLKSRFTNFLDFKDWNASDCAEYFEACSTKEGYSIDKEIREKFEEGCRVLIGLDGWANARDVKTLWEEIKDERSNRLISGPVEIEKSLTLEDVTTAIGRIIQSRIPGSTISLDASSDPLSELDRLFKADIIKEKIGRLRNTLIIAKQENSEIPPVGHFVFRGSPGKLNRNIVCYMIGNDCCINMLLYYQ
jgi:SpoVK/Ycf46/Vps4 family AAA+-type ATPase